jgi:hypothetical protein
MKLCRAMLVLLAGVILSTAIAQPSNSVGPDPNEIPVPPITIRMAPPPGAKDLAARLEIPDVLTMNNGGEVVLPAGTFPTGSVEMGCRTVLRLETDSLIAGSIAANA